MGKAINALHNAMAEINKDGKKLLNIDFMGNIFLKIYDDGPLEPLEEYMTHMFGEFWLVMGRYAFIYFMVRIECL